MCEARVFPKFWSTLRLLFRFFLFEVKDPKQHTEREREREKFLAFKAKKKQATCDSNRGNLRCINIQIIDWRLVCV